MKKVDYKELYEKSLECINTLEECICKLQDQLNRRFIDYEKLYIDYKILASENKRLDKMKEIKGDSNDSNK